MLKNKVAIVTGSSVGIGAAIARKLAEEGAKVIVTYLTHSTEADRLSVEIGAGCVCCLDVTDRLHVRRMMEDVTADFGNIDILVNNAGINHPADFDKQTDEEWDEVLNVDLKGVFICCQEVLPYITDNGRIINIGSLSGRYGGPRTPSYAAAKAGTMALTHCLARFLGHRGITVNNVEPGMIESDLLEVSMPKKLREKLMPSILLGRLGKKEEIAATVAFLASEGAGYITGQMIGVNGGVWTNY